jgi:hypothetical protein
MASLKAWVSIFKALRDHLWSLLLWISLAGLHSLSYSLWTRLAYLLMTPIVFFRNTLSSDLISSWSRKRPVYSQACLSRSTQQRNFYISSLTPLFFSQSKYCRVIIPSYYVFNSILAASGAIHFLGVQLKSSKERQHMERCLFWVYNLVRNFIHYGNFKTALSLWNLNFI